MIFGFSGKAFNEMSMDNKIRNKSSKFVGTNIPKILNIIPLD